MCPYYITVINLINEHNVVLSLMSFSNVSLNMGALETPDAWSVPTSHFGVTSHLLPTIQLQPYHPTEIVLTMDISVKQYYMSCKNWGTIDLS